MKRILGLLPPIPSQVFSTLGPMPVQTAELDGEMGRTNFLLRNVKLAPGMNPVSAWQTYWHEATHVALWDAGVHNALGSKVVENICDALGTYLAAAVCAGFLKVEDK